MKRRETMLHHITTTAAWAAARRADTYAPPSLSAEGFVHLSTSEQVLATANRFYPRAAGLSVLSIDGELIKGDVRWEEGEPGVLFPHLYRALHCSEIVAIQTLVAERGQWVRLSEPKSR